MSAGCAHALVFVLALGGFTALALAMERHQQDMFGKELTTRASRVLRLLGWLQMVAALWLAVAVFGWGFGLAAGSGHTSAAAGAVFVALLVLDRIKQRRLAAAR